MAEFGVVRAFEIDNDELYGKSAQEIFTLGYELALFDESLKKPEPFEMLIHADNFHRMLTTLRKSGRDYESSWMSEDVSETWMTIKVGPAEAEESISE